MTKVVLPRELVSLAHHVELNKAGWWEKALDQLIVSAVWLAKNSPAQSDIRHRLKEHFAISLDEATIEGRIHSLCEAGVVVSVDGRCRISEQHLAEYEREMESALAIEDRVRARFIATIENGCPALDGEQTWQSFHDRCLLPLVQEMGARTYEFVSGNRARIDGGPS